MGDAETKCKEIIVKVKVIRRKETPEGMPLFDENGIIRAMLIVMSIGRTFHLQRRNR